MMTRFMFVFMVTLNSKISIQDANSHCMLQVTSLETKNVSRLSGLVVMNERTNERENECTEPSDFSVLQNHRDAYNRTKERVALYVDISCIAIVVK